MKKCVLICNPNSGKNNKKFLVKQFIQILNETDFESACYLIYRAYMKSERLTITDITSAFIELYFENQNINEIDVWKLIEKACW